MDGNREDEAECVASEIKPFAGRNPPNIAMDADPRLSASGRAASMTKSEDVCLVDTSAGPDTISTGDGIARAERVFQFCVLVPAHLAPMLFWLLNWSLEPCSVECHDAALKKITAPVEGRLKIHSHQKMGNYELF